MAFYLWHLKATYMKLWLAPQNSGLFRLLHHLVLNSREGDPAAEGNL